MASKTRQEAVAKAHKTYGKDIRGYVYQFPKGHWDVCFDGSPVADDIFYTGYIYYSNGIKARDYYRLP